MALRRSRRQAPSSTAPYPSTHCCLSNSWMCFRTEQLALKQAAQPDGRFSMDAISTELSLRWKAMGAEAKEPDEQAAHDAKKVHAALHPNYRYTRVSKKYMAQILAQQEATEEETEEHFRTVQGFFEVHP
ncbi:uncharacterized protein TRAVEDRAFT_17620 [Trametes versicolor FP-101664 SS1]|uniref:uncharacterized protein n=1 Tax=Trametes versicolor (strain FP-101664) TaxID=717944 RepID=UPI0004622519|nr:uncharacterized protein TRAVEDRAFT_17620 [Trametes versicolor FP-101664 SS1]EIW63174.1 hypothetical protein TRAVEDRAFT_17620 [Trametes versicolor FP-101664 SS1]